jgi:Na+-driven multidrug efflux pump
VPGIWIAYPLSNIALSAVVIYMLWKDIRRFENKPAEQVIA